jgi:hypothetical protein
VAVSVDHAGHDDAAVGVDLHRAVRRGQADAHLRDAVTDHQHVPTGQDGVRVVHGENQTVTEQHRPAVVRVTHRRQPPELSPVVGSTDRCPAAGHVEPPVSA